MSSGTSLLVVDVQQALFNRPIPIHNADALLSTLGDLIGQAHDAGATVVYIQHCNKMMLPGSDGWRLHLRLAPRADDLLVQKTHGDAFQDTDLDDLLRSRGVSSVVVTGLVSHGCVTATCRGALSRGYAVTLVSDGHSNYNRKAADLISQCNEQLRAESCTVMPASEVRLSAG